MNPGKICKPHNAFTLAELLISLAILGVIAAFTIPKILSVQKNNSYNAIAKEAMALIAEAHQKHMMNGQLSVNTNSIDLTPYMNYLSITTSGNIDDRPNNLPLLSCSAMTPCLKLHNGAILQPLSDYFSGTATTNYVAFTLDPDGVYTGKADSLRVLIYYNGRLLDRNNCLPGSLSSAGTPINPITNGNPDWFSY